MSILQTKAVVSILHLQIKLYLLCSIFYAFLRNARGNFAERYNLTQLKSE